jgi:hypothetical protein
VDHTPDPGAWPLSAPATALLRDPRTAPGALLRLALRELVVRGAVTVHPVDRRGRRPATVRLAPGGVSVGGLPSALRPVAEALLPHLAGDSTSAADAVSKASGWRADLASRAREAARQELRTAGLLAEERDRLLGVVPRTRWRLTPSGQAWARSAGSAPAAAALPAAGLLLALDDDLQRRWRDAAVADGHGTVAWDDGELDALDTVLGDAGPALDSAADGASGSGGDGGGDGGGGGGD